MAWLGRLRGEAAGQQRQTGEARNLPETAAAGSECSGPLL